MSAEAVTDPVIAMDRLRMQVGAGVVPDDDTDLPPRSRRAIAVATAVGAPLLEAIDGAQAAEDDAARARRAIAVASAQTRVVAAGLLVAPLLLVPGLGRLVGVDLAAFYTSGLGLMILAIGSALLMAGGGMVIGLVRRVGRSAAPPVGGRRSASMLSLATGLLVWWLVGPFPAPVAAVVVHRTITRRRIPKPVVGVDEAADLMATALAGGVGAPEALRVVADQLPELGNRLRRLAFGLELGMSVDDLTGPSRSRPGSGGDGSTPASLAARGPRTPRQPRYADGLLRLVTILATADELGAPVAPTLRRLARDLRADELARILAAAERLPAQLSFPTTLCLLPATVLLIGAPIVHVGLVSVGA